MADTFDVFKLRVCILVGRRILDTNVNENPIIVVVLSVDDRFTEIQGGNLASGLWFRLAEVASGVPVAFVQEDAARRLFGFKRDVAAVLASGISVCGVSAAIATTGAIRAKPVIPVTISMVVVIFAMIELIVLPGFYTALLPDQPIVNGAWPK